MANARSLARRVKPRHVERFHTRYRIDASGCWLWTAGARKNGYGVMSLGHEDQAYAHRVSYFIHKGELPPDMEVCHKCDVRLCVNPDHLFAGTRQDNIRDMHSKGRAAHQKLPRSHFQAVARRNLAPYWSRDTHSSAKLTTKDVEVARYLAARGAYYVDIARVFGVSDATIGNLLGDVA